LNRELGNRQDKNAEVGDRRILAMYRISVGWCGLFGRKCGRKEPAPLYVESEAEMVMAGG
jgi:hypothetical protein